MVVEVNSYTSTVTSRYQLLVADEMKASSLPFSLSSPSHCDMLVCMCYLFFSVCVYLVRSVCLR